MYTIEQARDKYYNELKGKINYWKKSLDAEQAGLSNSNQSQGYLDFYKAKMLNFEDEFNKMVIEECKSVIEALKILKNHVALNTINEILEKKQPRSLATVAQRDDGTYTRLGLSVDDIEFKTLLTTFKNYSGVITPEMQSAFVDSICAKYGVSDVLQETKSRSI